MRATELLHQDHERVHELLEQALRTPVSHQRQELLDKIAAELEIHAEVEEEIFYPAVREVSRRIDDAVAAHDHVRMLLDRLDQESAVQALKQSVLAHVAEEEGGIFIEAGRLGAEKLEALGRQIAERKQALSGSRKVA